MQALRFANGRLSMEEIPRPIAGADALIRVTTSGICNTDVEIVRGYAGFEGTIGHEFVGVVETSPDRPEIVGRRVVGEINAGCGTCPRCLRGDPRHCPTRTVLGIYGRDGAHAEYLTLPSGNLLVVPDHVADEQAVFAEPLAAAFGITEQVDIGPDTRLVVIGDGKLGLLCAISLTSRSKSVDLVGKHPAKMSIAAKYGVRGVLLSDVEPAMNGEYDVVVEASGSESGFATALDLVRPLGKIVLKSTFHGSPTWAASRVVVDEITIVGSRCGRFAPALELLSNGSIDLAPFVDEVISLRRGVDAMAAATRPGALKVLLTPEK